MARLPQPGGDSGTWGEVLNDFLSAVHKTDGTLKASSVNSGALAPGAVVATAIQDGTITEAKLDSAAQAKLNSGGTAGVTSVNTRTGAVTLAKADVGLANVDNTSDASKPVSTATQTALNAKVNTSSLAAVATSGDYADLTNKPTIPTVTGTNTGDQTLSYLAGDLTISGTNGNTVSIPVGTVADNSLTPAKLASDTPVSGEVLSYNGTGFEWVTPAASGGGGEANTTSNIGTGGVGVYKQKTGLDFELKSVRAASTKLSVTDNTGNNTLDLDVVTANLGLTKSDVGLANVDNTSDASKPVSTAAQTALNLKATDSAVVHNTGAETVAGVKTFSSSPIVPTPSTGTQAANKAYVDTVAGAGAPDATTTTNGIVRLAGDLAGTAAAPTVPGLAGKANTSHTHAATDLASGTVATARLGSGTANSSTFLRGDNTWATPAGGGSGYTFTFRSVNTATATAANFDCILVDTTSTGVTITLPAPVANGLVRIKRLTVAGNGLQVAAPGGSYIDAVSVGTDTLNNQYDSRDYWSDGNNWYR